MLCIDQWLTDISRDIATFGYLPRQSMYKLMFFNYNIYVFLTVTSL